jgi:hypothetical protein
VQHPSIIAADVRDLPQRLKLGKILTDMYLVERRSEDRLPLEPSLLRIDVRVTTIAPPARSYRGYLADVSKSGLCVMLPQKLGAGEVVQLQIADSNLFGFIVHAGPEGDAFRAGIEIQRVLMGGSDLSKILHIALQRILPGIPGVAVHSLRA